jgi:hypothetical protein
LRRAASEFVLIPETTVLWAISASRDKLVLEHAKGAEYVISSSPPESAHIAAAAVANKVGARLIVDMRDGWLDEPLKPQLQSSVLRRWREGRQETRILRQAHTIFVTSAEWRRLIEERHDFVRGKCRVLTNVYPEPPFPISKATSPRFTLLHAGRFSGSSNARDPGLLLNVLWQGIRGSTTREGEVVLLGDLTAADIAIVDHWKPRFRNSGWQLSVRSAIGREQMIVELQKAGGLLLLSASMAAIPSKIFEYIPTSKPILAVCPRGSAVWSLGGRVPQMFLADSQARENVDTSTVIRFLEGAISGTCAFEIPREFSDKHAKGIFLREMAVPIADTVDETALV